MARFNRWLRSKAGMGTIAGVIVVLLALVIVGQQAGWWDSLGITGSAGVKITLPAVSYPDPKGEGGVTCLPTCSATDGKFMYIANADMFTFSGEKVVVWIGVPGNKADFSLDIFDGDSGKNVNNDAIKWEDGNFDDTNVESEYVLYADPLKDNTGTQVVASWKGNTDGMRNNEWFANTIANVAAAQAPSRHYFYRLEVTQPLVSPTGGNSFKLRSNGYLTMGRYDLVKSSIGFMGGLSTISDRSILYKDYVSPTSYGESTYNGDWQFYVYVPQNSKSLTIWDGDFDRGTNPNKPVADDDDPNTEGIPDFAGPFTKAEGYGGEGNPKDNSRYALYRRNPEVQYTLVDPAGNPKYTNTNPSGTEEWERFVLSADPSITDADMTATKIDPGFYVIQITGLDLHNIVFLRTDKEVCDPVSGCGPCVWPGCNASACPRTIGYWKNNVRKVYINNTTNGVQESKETLDWALKAVAMQSPIYRAGLVDWIKANPKATTIAPIATAAPLSPTEADAILQKTTAFGNSMMGRALQQNLATWLNFASGKISDNAVIVIDVPSGKYSGTMFGALLEAQNIMLKGGNIERAKDIADMINNGKVNSDPASNVDGSGNVNCTIYSTVAPTDKQPKKYDELPKAPKQQEPGPAQPEQDPDPNTCNAVSNNYHVENPTFNPFYSIKFEYKSGTEVKNGAIDEFKYTLTNEQLASMTSMQLEAKAGQDVGQVTMDCDFASGMMCGPVTSQNMLFAFTFVGTTDNGDGTVTLTFQVQNYSSSGLSHASFGLPSGVIPSGPTNGGSYDSKVCPQ